MKRKLIISGAVSGFLILFLYFAFDQITPEEIENAPDWMTLDVALTQAEESEKWILVDIYEIGCQYCRAMERDVYPSETIRALIDRNFLPVKVNGNSEELLTYKGVQMTHAGFAAEMGVTAFPYTVVMNNKGEVVDSRRGYMGTMDLSRFLNAALDSGQSASL